jgi:hypothetical protein
MEKTSGDDRICKVDIGNVGLEVIVPAFTTPGTYVGTLVIDLDEPGTVGGP